MKPCELVIFCGGLVASLACELVMDYVLRKLGGCTWNLFAACLHVTC